MINKLFIYDKNAALLDLSCTILRVVSKGYVAVGQPICIYVFCIISSSCFALQFPKQLSAHYPLPLSPGLYPLFSVCCSLWIPLSLSCPLHAPCSLSCSLSGQSAAKLEHANPSFKPTNLGQRPWTLWDLAVWGRGVREGSHIKAYKQANKQTERKRE